MSNDDVTGVDRAGEAAAADSRAASDPAIEVRDELENHRFALLVDDEYAGFAYYEKFTGMRDFTHTEIASAFEGRGLSKVLIQEALVQALAAGDEIVATCPAVRRFLRKNPDYARRVREA